jgi:outer membrane lipoprotein-sorting protein
MKILTLLFLSLTFQEIQNKIRNNFLWIKDVQGDMELKIFFQDTSFTQVMKFYMEREQKRIKCESNGEKVIFKENKIFLRDKFIPFPEIPDTGNIFPQGKINISLKEGIIEIECEPYDPTSGILNYKFYIDKNTYNIKNSEITTKFGVIYTNFEYEKYSEGYFYKSIKIILQSGIILEIRYKNVKINEGISEKVWK